MQRTIKQSVMYPSAPLYASSLYASLTIKESTTVVNQLTSSYKYMLGDVSRALGVQSYSDSSKHWSSFDEIRPDIRARARDMIGSNDEAAVSLTLPPRWVDLLIWFTLEVRIYTFKVTYRRFVRERSSSLQATWKCSRLAIIWAICVGFCVVARRCRIVSPMLFFNNESKDCG